MEHELISLGCLIIGYLLGWFPYRKNNAQDCYSDMKGFADAYSNLCIQLVNQRDTVLQKPPVGFNYKVGNTEESNDTLEEAFDLTGGQL